MMQPSLPFDAPMAEANSHARASDGPGSHVAAERVFTGINAHIDRQLVYQAIKRYPGSTSKELAKLANLDRHMVGRRAPDCLRRGLVTRTEGPPPGCEWRWWPA